MGNPLIQVMGAMDGISAIVMVLLHFNIISWKIGVAMAIYLFLKAYMWKGDVASVIDGITGVWLLLVSFGLQWTLTYLFVAYLLQKSMISFF